MTGVWIHYNFGCSLVRTLGVIAANGTAALERNWCHDCLYSFVVSLQKKIKKKFSREIRQAFAQGMLFGL